MGSVLKSKFIYYISGCSTSAPAPHAPHHGSGCPIPRQPENRRVGNSLPTLLAEKQNSLVSCQVIFCWLDWLSGCLTLHNCLMLLSFPLRPAERSIFFSGKSVRLFDGARSATSSHAAKKGCGVRVVRAANLHVGVAFLLL